MHEIRRKKLNKALLLEWGTCLALAALFTHSLQNFFAPSNSSDIEPIDRAAQAREIASKNAKTKTLHGQTAKNPAEFTAEVLSISCLKSQMQRKTKALNIRLSIKNCEHKNIQSITATNISTDVALTTFFVKDQKLIATDIFQLQKGENLIQFKVALDSGKTKNFQLKILQQ